MQERVALALGHRVEVSPADDRRVSFDDPDLTRDRLGGQPVIAGHDDDPNPRVLAARDRAGDLRSRRIGERGQPDEGQMRLDQVPRAVLEPGDVPFREAEHAQPAARVALERVTHLRAIGVGDRAISHHGADRGAPREQLERGPFGVVPKLTARLLVEPGHPLQVRVEVEHALAASFALALGAGHVTTELRRRDQERALGRIAAAAPPVAIALQGGVVAPERGAQQAPEKRRRRRDLGSDLELGARHP